MEHIAIYSTFIIKKEEILMFPPIGFGSKDVKKGSGFGKFAILNDALRALPVQPVQTVQPAK
jgi:hypothetical protein